MPTSSSNGSAASNNRSLPSASFTILDAATARRVRVVLFNKKWAQPWSAAATSHSPPLIADVETSRPCGIDLSDVGSRIEL
jgi:hypothetical protein